MEISESRVPAPLQSAMQKLLGIVKDYEFHGTTHCPLCKLKISATLVVTAIDEKKQMCHGVVRATQDLEDIIDAAVDEFVYVQDDT
jgi:hypothetical protein